MDWPLLPLGRGHGEKRGILASHHGYLSCRCRYMAGHGGGLPRRRVHARARTDGAEEADMGDGDDETRAR